MYLFFKKKNVKRFGCSSFVLSSTYSFQTAFSFHKSSCGLNSISLNPILLSTPLKINLKNRTALNAFNFLKVGNMTEDFSKKSRKFSVDLSNSYKINRQNQGISAHNEISATKSEIEQSNGHESLTQQNQSLKNKSLTEIEYSLDNFHRSNQDTCLVHKPSVFEGQWVQSGDLLADCSASVGGELALGQNLLIAYMPWEGYNFEDAILISERLVYDDLYTSVHIERYEVELRETKQGNEEITREIPDVPESFLKHLNTFGIAKLGTWVEEGDILVGKVTPVNKKNQSNYQKLLYTILDKTVLPIRDSSLRAPKGIKAKVIGVQIFKHPKNSVITNYTNFKSADKTKLKSSLNPILSTAKDPKVSMHQKNTQVLLKINKKLSTVNNQLIYGSKDRARQSFLKLNKNDSFLKYINMPKIFHSKAVKKNENRSGFPEMFSILNSGKIDKGLKQSFIELSLEKLSSYKNIFVTNNNFNLTSIHANGNKISINSFGSLNKSLETLTNHTLTTHHYIKSFYNTPPLKLSNVTKNSLIKPFDTLESKNNTQKPYFLMNQAKELITKNNFLELSQRNKFLKKNTQNPFGDTSPACQPISKEVIPKNSFPLLTSQNVSSIQIYLAEKRRIQVGDKMAGRHGNKGIISQILPIEDMPFLPDGRPLDMVLNPLGVPSRMNVGQIYECLLGLAGKYLGENYKIFPFDEIYGAEASRSFVFSKLYSASLKTGKKWLFNPNSPGKIRLYDGRTGDTFDQSITVGYAYMLRLVHMVDDKIHARSTGPYSLVTQQPLRGRSKQGGQRLGEMEVWALEGYGAAFTLLEMLTIKSDDMTGRMTLWSNLILNKEISIGTPESFKVLICELQALCLDIGLFKVE